VDIAAALANLLDRAGTGPDNDQVSRRVVAKTRAAAATSPRPPTEPDATTAIDTPALADDGIDDDPDQPVAAVIPFGVFDARAEAERFW
jgi:hypothetical protein